MKKILRGLLVYIMLLAIIMPNVQVFAGASIIKEDLMGLEKGYKTIDKLKEAVKINKKANVLIYDSQGKIIKELHSDGMEVDYQYSNGKIVGSTDNLGFREKYEEYSDEIKIKVYKNGEMVDEKTIENDNEKNSISNINTENVSKTITLAATATNEDYKVNGVVMNSLITDSEFINYGSMTTATIQTFLTNKNSILKDTILVYRVSATGTIYFDGTNINPASQIYISANTHKVNPKLILVQLQKESSLISATPGSVSLTSRRFYYAMGYGATDGGDIQGTSGLDKQINGGARTLRQHYDSAPSIMPYNFTGINYGSSITIGGVVYPNNIWVRNKGTYSLYKYTPHTFDIKLYNSSGIIGGGNYLFYQIFKGYWTTWN